MIQWLYVRRRRENGARDAPLLTPSSHGQAPLIGGGKERGPWSQRVSQARAREDTAAGADFANACQLMSTRLGGRFKGRRGGKQGRRGLGQTSLGTGGWPGDREQHAETLRRWREGVCPPTPPSGQAGGRGRRPPRDRVLCGSALPGSVESPGSAAATSTGGGTGAR
ncbi:unnamed protein product [Gadus morhua 'NCC']